MMVFDPGAVPSGLAEIQAAAAQSAAAHIAEGGAPAPETPAGGETPAPAATPDSSLAAPATPSPEPSATPSGQTTTPVEPTFDATTWSPEAQYGLKLEGWDGKSPVSMALVQKLSERHRDFNNRLAAAAQPADPAAPPAPGAPPVAAAPTPPAPPTSTAPVAPTQDAYPTEEQFETQVRESLKTDQVCEGLVTEFVAAEDRVSMIDSEIIKHEIELQKQNAYLEHPAIKDNPIESEQIERKVQVLGMQLERLRTERIGKQLTMDQKADQYERRANLIRNQRANEIQQRVTQTRRAQALKQNWTPALERVFANNNVSKAERNAVALRIRDAFVADVTRGETVAELEGFMDRIAKQTLKEFDDAHRMRSASYAEQAAIRAAAGTTPPVPGAPSPAASTPTTEEPKTLPEFYAQRERERNARLSGQR